MGSAARRPGAGLAVRAAVAPGLRAPAGPSRVATPAAGPELQNVDRSDSWADNEHRSQWGFEMDSAAGFYFL